MSDNTDLPNYDDLPYLADSTERHAWHVWGAEDQLGSLNRIGTGQVLAAAQLVSDGRVVSLDLPLTEPSPGLFLEREPLVHVETQQPAGRDDRLDNFYLQGSSQWDGLRHIRSFTRQYWGGRKGETLDETGALGIDHWAEKGLIGRGVLVDVAGHLKKRGTPIDAATAFEIDVELLQEILDDQGASLKEGDFLLIRTSWIEWYRSQPEAHRNAMRGTVGSTFSSPGLASSQGMARFLWDSGVAGVIADNPALEVLPVVSSLEKGFMHRRLLPLLGIAIGELWWLPDLAEHCRQMMRWEFMLVSGVLKLPRGVGSPSNAYAIL